jgi:hypothetical protein
MKARVPLITGTMIAAMAAASFAQAKTNLTDRGPAGTSATPASDSATSYPDLASGAMPYRSNSAHSGKAIRVAGPTEKPWAK